jgi:hypothetical protein
MIRGTCYTNSVRFTYTAKHLHELVYQGWVDLQSTSLKMDEDSTRPPEEIPAAHLHLIDTRSNNRSQRMSPEKEIK